MNSLRKIRGKTLSEQLPGPSTAKDSDNETFDSDDSIKDKDYVIDDSEKDRYRHDSSSDVCESDDIVKVTSKSSAKKRKTVSQSMNKPSKKTTSCFFGVKKSKEVIASTPKKYLDYFKYELKEGAKTGVCLICEKNKKDTSIKMKSGNTKGLKYHLSKNHPTEFSMFFGKDNKKSSKQQKTIAEIFSFESEKASSKRTPTPNTPQYFEKYVKWISIKYLPFNFFDDESTREFFKDVHAENEPPRRTIMRRYVMEIFSKKQQKVLKVLQENTSNISFTIDGWSSISGKSFYGITSHFVDKDWTMQSLVLDFVPSHGEHTGMDIANIFYTSMEKYDLLNKIQGITVDNASVNTKFLEKFQEIMEKNGKTFNAENQHFRCFAHILNLGVQDILKLLKQDEEKDEEMDDDTDQFYVEEEKTYENMPPITRLRTLFKKIKYSEQLQNKLKVCCEASNIAYLTVTLDISTRWNSTYEMILLGIKMKTAIDAFCENNQKFKCFKLNQTEWEMLGLVQKYLRCFKYLSNTLSGDSYPTLPLVIIGFNMLIDRIENLMIELEQKTERSPSDGIFIEAFRAGRDKMLKHYYKANWVYCASLLIDPRHKLETFAMTFWGAEMKNKSYQKFEAIYCEKYAPTRPIPPIQETEEQSGSDEDMDIEFLFKKATPQSETEEFWKQELNAYFYSERASKGEILLEWWKRNEVKNANVTESFVSMRKMFKKLFELPDLLNQTKDYVTVTL
ncbi:unnamed protein product [Brassicogethes aeneus]|uniref:Transposase n=1 Tax=Brassicogethes aeneus TaxID=1431903 RepID=A0A9P0FJL8_BRAAE|nr:unnamed protein product [Brassicogethes aeneus]